MFTQSSVLDEPTADFFKGDVQNLLLIADCFMAAVFSLGAGLFLGSLVIVAVTCCRAKNRRKPVSQPPTLEPVHSRRPVP